MKTHTSSTNRGVLLGAGAIVALAAVLAFTDLVSEGWADRIMMVVLGGILVVYGNSFPKTLRPLSAMRCETTREQSLRRLSGWFYVLVGLTWIVAWLALSESLATTITVVTVIASVLVMAGHVTWCLRQRRRAEPTPGL